MRIMLKRSTILLVFLIAAGTGFSQQTVQPAMEWKIVKELDLKAAPLDVSSSEDGRWLFILTPGEIIVYSVPQDTITARIPVGEEFDRISSLPGPDRLSISSSARKTLQLILLERVHQIDVSGLPFKGAADAPIIVAVFTDYQ
jgi:hypothetical protein